MENNRTVIMIPSKARVEVFEKNALPWLFHIKVPWILFVEPQDAEAYNEMWKRNNLNMYSQEYVGHHGIIRFLRGDNQGLGTAKEWMRHFAVCRHEFIFKIDDDVKGFTNYRKQISDPKEIAKWVEKIIQDAEKAFDDERVGGVAFPYSFEMFDKEGWTVTKRMQTAYITRLDMWHGNKAISVFEDFAQGLYILTQGKLIIKHGLAGISMGVGVGKGTGGHQSRDRAPQAMAEVEELRKIYPPLKFRKVDKPWGIEPDLSSVELGNKQPIPRRT